MAIAKRGARRQAVDPHRSPLNAERRKDLVNRLRSARGHIDHVINSLDSDPYVIDVLQQLAAVRGSIDASIRLGLRYYCEHGFVPAMRAGAAEAAIDELMSALSFLKQLS
jgi:CsoR family transcriptional regulator, copper-sensing transcriptional repressor